MEVGNIGQSMVERLRWPEDLDERTAITQQFTHYDIDHCKTADRVSVVDKRFGDDEESINFFAPSVAGFKIEDDEAQPSIL